MIAVNATGRRPRVLQLSYACSPSRGSESGVGWQRAVQSAKHFDTWVICEEHEFAGDIRRPVGGPVPRLAAGGVHRRGKRRKVKQPPPDSPRFQPGTDLSDLRGAIIPGAVRRQQLEVVHDDQLNLVLVSHPARSGPQVPYPEGRRIVNVERHVSQAAH